MNIPKWVVTIKRSEYGAFEASDPLGEVVVTGNLNGCMTLRQYSGGGRFFSDDEDPDSWHVCSIDALIERLQTLKALIGTLERGEEQAPCQHWYKAGNAERSWCQACGVELPHEPVD